jgi:hypothetical protein
MCQKKLYLCSLEFNYVLNFIFMAERSVIIGKSKKTGWWSWTVYCGNEPVAGGSTITKKEAKRQAGQVECDTPPEIKIEPPIVSAIVNDGHLFSFEMYCPLTEENKNHLVPNDMSENTAFWVFGLDCYDNSLSKKYELVSAMLKIWNVYKGGDSADTVKTLHNLSDQNFDIISAKTWKKIKLTVNEDENKLYWDIII